MYLPRFRGFFKIMRNIIKYSIVLGLIFALMLSITSYATVPVFNPLPYFSYLYQSFGRSFSGSTDQDSDEGARILQDIKDRLEAIDGGLFQTVINAFTASQYNGWINLTQATWELLKPFFFTDTDYTTTITSTSDSFSLDGFFNYLILKYNKTAPSITKYTLGSRDKTGSATEDYMYQLIEKINSCKYQIFIVNQTTATGSSYHPLWFYLLGSNIYYDCFNPDYISNTSVIDSSVNSDDITDICFYTNNSYTNPVTALLNYSFYTKFAFNYEVISFSEFGTSSITSTYSSLDSDLVSGSTGTFDIITPGRTIADDGSITGDLSISVPTTADQVLAKAEEGYTSIAQDNSTSIVNTISQTVVKSGTAEVGTSTADVITSYTELSDLVGGMVTGLTDVFPFCIPWDIYDIISAFNVSPEAPKFTWKFPDGSGDYVYQEFDFSKLDYLATTFRQCEYVLFVFGLAMATRKIYLSSL